METFLNMLWRHMQGQESPHNTLILRAFCLIEQSPVLYRQYLSVCRHYRSGEHYVNPHIAQEIKRHYHLHTTGVKQKVINETTLIKSYSELQ